MPVPRASSRNIARSCTGLPHLVRKRRSSGICAFNCGSNPTFTGQAAARLRTGPRCQESSVRGRAEAAVSSSSDSRICTAYFHFLLLLCRQRWHRRQTLLDDQIHGIPYGNPRDAAPFRRPSQADYSLRYPLSACSANPAADRSSGRACPATSARAAWWPAFPRATAGLRVGRSSSISSARGRRPESAHRRAIDQNSQKHQKLDRSGWTLRPAFQTKHHHAAACRTSPWPLFL